MSINKWMDKQVMVYPYNEYSWAIKRNELLMHTITWIDLKVIMLSKKPRHKRRYIIPFI